MNNQERIIKHHTLSFDVSSKKVKANYSLDDFLDGLESAIGTGKATKSIKLNGSAMELELVSFARDSSSIDTKQLCAEFRSTYPTGFNASKSDYAICYMTITNTSEAAQVKKNKASGSTNANDLGADDAYIFGCHVLIHKKWDITQQECLIYIETVRNIGRSLIERLLRHIIEQIHKERQALGQKGFLKGPDREGKKSNGKVIEHGYRLMAKVKGIPSDSIQSIVDKGLATSMYLERTSSGVSLGGRNYLKAQSEELKLIFEKKNLVANAWNDVLKFLSLNKSQYKSARIKFKTSTGDPGEAVIDTATGHLLEDKFVKGTTINGITPKLRTSAGGIVPHFLLLAFKHLP